MTVTKTNSQLLPLLTKILPRSNLAKAFIVYFIWLTIKYRRSVLGVRPRPDLPGPPGLPLIGNAWETIRMRPDQVNQTHYARHLKYGKTCTVTIPLVGRVINITDPEMLDHVLRINFAAYVKGPRFQRVLEPMVGQGIFSADGEHWKWQRKLASHIFNVKAFREYTSNVFVNEARLVLDYLGTKADADQVVDLQDIFHKYTLDSFGEIAFGGSFGCLTNPESQVPFAAAFDRLSNMLAGRTIQPFWRIQDWWSGNNKRIAADSKLLQEFSFSVIHKRRLENEQQEKEGVQPKRDLLQLFMETQDDKGQPLSDELLKDQMLNFVLAGRDTTAQALAWTFYLMHRTQASPKIVQDLEDETEQILHGGNPTYESTRKQKYAEACFYEALRLYPSVPKNIKTCVEDDVLPGGIKVYKGDRIAWSSYTMGRDTSLWGPDATGYNPERWLKGDKASPSKFVAFHLGPRTCLGQQFATIEAITLMSMMTREYTFELVDPDTEPAYLPALTLPLAKGLPVRVRRRTHVTAV